MVTQSQLPPSALPVLLTRPETQGARFADSLRVRFGQGLALILSPLLAPRFLAPALPMRDFSALILTSETAVQAASEMARRISAETPALPSLAYCVGDTTAAAARAAKFSALSANGDAADLIALILTRHRGGTLLHLHGQETRGDIGQTLISAGIDTFSAVVYAQDPQPLSAAATDVLCQPGPVIVPLFSPRTASLFGAAVRNLPLCATLHVAAFSAAVADALPAGLVANCAICARPTAGSMLETVDEIIRSVQRA